MSARRYFNLVDMLRRFFFDRLPGTRLAALLAQDETARRLVQYAAVAGLRFEVDLVARAAGLSPEEAADLLAQIGLRTRGGLRRVEESAEFEFGDESIRLSVLASLGDQRLDMCRDLASLLAALPSPPHERIAHLYEEGGDPYGAARHTDLVAREALAAGEHGQALGWARRLSESLAGLGLGEGAPERLAAFELEGRALNAAGRFRETVARLRPLADHAASAERPELLRELGWAGANLPDQLSRRRAVAELERARDLSTDPDLTGHLWADLVVAYDGIGKYDASKAAYQEASNLARKTRAQDLEMRVRRDSCIFFSPEKVIDKLRSETLARESRGDLRQERAFCENNLGTAFFRLQRLTQARSSWEESRMLLEELGGELAYVTRNNLALLALVSSELDTAERWLEEAGAQADDSADVIFTRSNLALVAAGRGDLLGARDLLARLALDADRTGDAFYRDCVRSNLARVWLDLDEPDEAISALTGCPPHHTTTDDELVQARRARLLLEAGRRRGDGDAQRERLLRQAHVLDVTTKPQAWLYRFPWVLCDIEFW